MIKKYSLFILMVIFASLYLAFFEPTVQAVDLKSQITGQMQAGAQSAGFGAAKDPRLVAALVIKVFLEFVGVTFLILLAIASFWYITARGQEEKITKATSTIRRAIIGILVVMAAYSITLFVTQRAQEAVNNSAQNDASELINPYE